MRAWVVSDLHLEFGRRFDVPVPPDADVMICAGDILVKGIVPTLEWLAATAARHLPVIVVAGNHEFYGAAMIPAIQEARAFAAQNSNVHFLENDTAEIDGIAFIGGTLWTDFKLGGRDPEVAMFHAERGLAGQSMNDYKRIKYTKTPYRKFKPIHAYRKHMETREFIASELRANAGRRTVVVTHHAPSIRSLPLKYRGDPLSPCYASDLEDLIMETQPEMWVHGHIHQRVEYHVGLTKVVSNPRGYPGERSGLKPDFTVEI
jgi:Icc-related predicted phosphoesterase